MTRDTGHETRDTRRVSLRVGAALALLAAFGMGCQQRMAEQPYYRAYVPTDLFKDGRSNRPLEPGVIHRGQRLDNDPLVTGLTQSEWARAWKYGTPPKPDSPDAKNLEDPARVVAANIGSPRYAPKDPDPDHQVYVKDFPFEITARDLRRGKDRYTAFCAECHGPLGNGQGKIWERGYLKPTSFHTRPIEGNEPPKTEDIPLGYSRGYWRWGFKQMPGAPENGARGPAVPMREAPVGYFFEVISRGYGGMPDYAMQVAPEDRWRIIAYIRTLQFSQHADVNSLSEGLRKTVTEAGGKK